MAVVGGAAVFSLAAALVYLQTCQTGVPGVPTPGAGCEHFCVNQCLGLAMSMGMGAVSRISASSGVFIYQTIGYLPVYLISS